MALLLICHLMLLAFVSCQTQNSTDLPETETTTEQQNYLDQNVTGNIVNATSQNPSLGTDTTSTGGVDDGDDGRDDSLADYFQKKLGELIGVGGTDAEEIETALSETDLQNCSLPDIIGLYCRDLPKDLQLYFQYDTPVWGMLEMIFQADIIENLQANCTPGNWCLPDSFHQDIKQRKNHFYLGGPFCTDAMWSCLKTFRDKRVSCGEKQLNFLVSSVYLLCDLESIGILTDECYTRTMEALYVSYADMTNPDGWHVPNSDPTECEEFTVQMTKTYLCADDACNFDQNVLLENFESWIEIAKTAPDLAITCNISRTCQYEEDQSNTDPLIPFNYYNDNGDNEDNTNTEFDNYGYGYEGSDKELSDEDSKQLEEELNKELDEIIAADEDVDETTPWEDEGESNSVDEEETEGNGSDETVSGGEVNANADDGYDKHDRSMMLGLIVMTTALLLGFVGLAFVVYKRFKRARNGGYKWGYSQLAHEDPRAVHSDYK